MAIKQYGILPADSSPSNKFLRDDGTWQEGGGGGGSFTLRENMPYDYTITDFSVRDEWTPLDLTGKIPAGTKFIFVRVIVKCTTASKIMGFRKYGNTGDSDGHWACEYVASSTCYTDMGPIGVSNDLKIEYYVFSGTTWNTISMVITGYG
jgi:hypothetical protein